MPRKSRKPANEVQNSESDNLTEEKENDSGVVKCSCPMKKHPNNSRICNKKKSAKSKQNSKKMESDSDSDSDFEPETKVSLAIFITISRFFILSSISDAKNLTATSKIQEFKIFKNVKEN